MTLPLQIQNLRKVYAQQFALKDLSFSLRSGELFGLLGPNGAGKTTLISILTTLTEPTGGTAKIFDHDILGASSQTKQFVGCVPQEIVSHGFFTVDQVLKFHSGYYGLADNTKQINYLLDRLALEPHRNKLVSQLSGGMKRRLLIAKALVHSPPLLLLDEPTAGVDIELRMTLWEFVRELNQKGMTILLTTHYLDEAEEMCERIGVLNHGELIALDKTQNLIQQMTQREVVFTLTSKDPWPEMPENAQLKDNLLKARVYHDVPVGELISQLKIPVNRIRDISITEGNLEDAFVALLNQQKQ